MATTNAADRLGMQHEVLQPWNLEASSERVSVDLDNSADTPNKSQEDHTFSSPAFPTLHFQEDTQFWNNLGFLDDDGGLFQRSSGNLTVEDVPGDEAALHAQDVQRQNQALGGPTENIQTMPLGASWNWPDDHFNIDDVFVYGDGPQDISFQPAATAEGFVTPGLLTGVPTVDQSEPVNDSAPFLPNQEQNHYEFFDNLDPFQDAALGGPFDPSLSHQVEFPRAGPSEPMTALPGLSVTSTNEIHGTASNVQGFSSSTDAFSHNVWNDDQDIVLKPYTPQELQQNGSKEAPHIAKRLSSYNDPQPYKRPRHHINVTNDRPNPSLDLLANPTPEGISRASKRLHPDNGLQLDRYVREKKCMASVHANSDHDHDHLSQACARALVEILPPDSPRKKPRLLCPLNDTKSGDLGYFKVFQLKKPQPATEIKVKPKKLLAQGSENVCLQCKIRKKQCVPADGQSQSQSACMRCLALSNGDQEAARTLCVRPKDLEVNIISPDVYFDSYVDIAQQIPTPLSSAVQQRVAIHMTYIIKEIPHLPTSWESAALICNVEKHKVRGSDDIPIDMLNYQILNELRYRQFRGLHSRRMPSIGIPEEKLPKLSDLIGWAMSTLALAPNGAVGGLQGPLYQFASLYVEKEHRPLRELVKVALRHTALYNVCVGQMTLQLSPTSPVLYKVPPKLRVQICGPLIQHHIKLGKQLLKLILKALYGRHGPAKEVHVPLCIVWWLLMTIHGHALNDSALANWICCTAHKIDKKYLEDREMTLSSLLRTHQAIYHALFRRDVKSLCPILNKALIKLCGIGDEDIELLGKLHSLGSAMRQAKEDATVCLDERITLNENEELINLFEQIHLDGNQLPVTAPDDIAATNIAEVIDDTLSISSTFSESSKLWDWEGDKSQAKIKARAAEASELRKYWLARCMAEYYSQSWLFGY